MYGERSGFIRELKTVIRKQGRQSLEGTRFTEVSEEWAIPTKITVEGHVRGLT